MNRVGCLRLKMCIYFVSKIYQDLKFWFTLHFVTVLSTKLPPMLGITIRSANCFFTDKPPFYKWVKLLYLPGSVTILNHTEERPYN
jgi:hypothetical protein